MAATCFPDLDCTVNSACDVTSSPAKFIQLIYLCRLSEMLSFVKFPLFYQGCLVIAAKKSVIHLHGINNCT